MAKYNVLRPVEYDGKLYLPAGESPPPTARSASNGRDIPVDASGVIDLTQEQAAEMVLGQVRLAAVSASRPEKGQR